MPSSCGSPGASAQLRQPPSCPFSPLSPADNTRCLLSTGPQSVATSNTRQPAATARVCSIPVNMSSKPERAKGRERKKARRAKAMMGTLRNSQKELVGLHDVPLAASLFRLTGSLLTRTACLGQRPHRLSLTPVMHQGASLLSFSGCCMKSG